MENEFKKIEYFRKDDNSKITDLYNKYRKEFFLYTKKRFNLDDDIIYDIYQESFIALYDNIKEGRLTNLTGLLKTYLFRICLNKLSRYREKEKYIVKYEVPEIYEFEDSWTEIQEKVWEAVNELEDPCYTILSLYYWEDKSMTEIATITNYKNAQNVRNRKSLCFKILKEKLRKILGWDE